MKSTFRCARTTLCRNEIFRIPNLFMKICFRVIVKWLSEQGSFILLRRSTDEKPIKNRHYEGGIISFAEYLNRNKTPLFDVPIYIAAFSAILEVAIQYNDPITKCLFYANNIATVEGGTHLTGFRLR